MKLSVNDWIGIYGAGLATAHAAASTVRWIINREPKVTFTWGHTHMIPDEGTEEEWGLSLTVNNHSEHRVSVEKVSFEVRGCHVRRRLLGTTFRKPQQESKREVLEASDWDRFWFPYRLIMEKSGVRPGEEIRAVFAFSHFNRQRTQWIPFEPPARPIRKGP